MFYRVGSQFFITLGEDTTCSLDEHIVFGEIAEGHDVLLKLNETICDATHRPYQDIRFEFYLKNKCMFYIYNINFKNKIYTYNQVIPNCKTIIINNIKVVQYN